MCSVEQRNILLKKSGVHTLAERSHGPFKELSYYCLQELHAVFHRIITNVACHPARNHELFHRLSLVRRPLSRSAAYRRKNKTRLFITQSIHIGAHSGVNKTKTEEEKDRIFASVPKFGQNCDYGSSCCPRYQHTQRTRSTRKFSSIW